MSGSTNTHARLSPSGSKRWINCTASIGYIEANSHRISGDGSSSYSNEGTQAHEYAEQYLNGLIGLDDIPNDFQMPLGVYFNHLRELIVDNPKGEILIEREAPIFYEPDEIEKERDGKIVMERPTGTVDFALVTDDKIVIRDLKYGQGVAVDAEDNSQLAIYAMSIIRELQEDGLYDFDQSTVVDIGIVQPRYRGDEPVKTWVITLAELDTYCMDIETAVRIIKKSMPFFDPTPYDKNDSPYPDNYWLYLLPAGTVYLGKAGENFEWPDEKDKFEGYCFNTETHQWDKGTFEGWSGHYAADIGSEAHEWTYQHSDYGDDLITASRVKFDPGEDTCRWCPAKGFCAARLEAMSETFEVESFDALALLPDLTKEEKAWPVLNRLDLQFDVLGKDYDDQQLLAIKAKRKQIISVLDDIDEYLDSRVLSGEAIPGLKVVKGREGNRAWNDIEGADKLIKQKLKMEERMDMSLKSPTQLEKLLKLSEQSTRFQNLFNGFVSRSEGKPVVALESDKRPAIEVSVNLLPNMSEDNDGLD